MTEVSDPLDVPLSDEELTMLRKLDSPPPVDTVMLSRGVHALAIRATREIQKLRARLDLLEPVYEIARAWRTAPDRREAEANFADLGPAIDHVLEVERTGCSVRVTSPAITHTEAHDFQRFEHHVLNRTGGRTTGHLNVVCRCGWSALARDLDAPDDDTPAAALDRLNEHIGEARARCHA